MKHIARRSVGLEGKRVRPFHYLGYSFMLVAGKAGATQCTLQVRAPAQTNPPRKLAI